MERGKKIGTRQLLNAVLVVLLAVLASPHAVSNIAANDVFLSDTTQSVVGIQNEYPATPGGDKPELNRAPEWVGESPQAAPFTYSTGPVPAQGIAFTVSQARAPPQS